MLETFVESQNKNVSRLHFGVPRSLESLTFRNFNSAIELLKSNKAVKNSNKWWQDSSSFFDLRN